MAIFKDAKDREWDFRLTTTMLRRIRERTGINLGDVIRDENKLVTVMFSDPLSFEGVLWCLVEDQAKAQQIDLDGFGEGFDGPAIERATEAFLECMLFFSRRAAVAEATKAHLPRLLKRMDGAIVDAVESWILKDAAGDAPASSASTPGH